MKPKTLIPLLVIVVLGAAGMYLWQRTQNHEPPAAALTLYGNVDIRQVQLAFNGSTIEIVAHDGSARKARGA
jgi:HlyD family secretion protein